MARVVPGDTEIATTCLIRAAHDRKNMADIDSQKL